MAAVLALDELIPRANITFHDRQAKSRIEPGPETEAKPRADPDREVPRVCHQLNRARVPVFAGRPGEPLAS
jgi:hypothetical protein